MTKRTITARGTAEAKSAPPLAIIVAGMVLASGPAGCGGIQKKVEPLPRPTREAKAVQAKTPQSQPVAKGWSPEKMLKQTWDEQSSTDVMRIELLKLRGEKALLELENLLKMMVVQRDSFDISALEPLGMNASRAAESIRKRLPESIVIWKFAEPLEKDVEELEGTIEGIRQGFARIKEERVRGVEKDLEKAQQRLRRRNSKKNRMEVNRCKLILSSVQAGALESDGQRQTAQALGSAMAEVGRMLEAQVKDVESLRGKVKDIIDRLNKEWAARLEALEKSQGISRK